MNRSEKIKDDELRSQIEDAYGRLRGGDPSAAVGILADAFIDLLVRHPELLELSTRVRGRDFPLVARWPSFGANLVLDPDRKEPPKIEFARQRFAVSEALTYYEFLVDLALAQGL